MNAIVFDRIKYYWHIYKKKVKACILLLTFCSSWFINVKKPGILSGLDVISQNPRCYIANLIVMIIIGSNL